jgi:hypothetical protein
MQENKKPDNDQQQRNLISLIFIVNGKQTIIEKVNINQPLKVAVEKALTQTGNTGRDLSDWLVKYNDKDLSISAKVGDLNLPDNAKIFMSLKSAAGGS